jgi:hypothetical protein
MVIDRNVFLVPGIVALIAAASAAGERIYLEAAPGPVVLDGASAYRLRFGLDASREPGELVFRLERAGMKSGAPSVPVTFSVNGFELSRITVAAHEFYTVRIPRLFLNAGANELVLKASGAEPLTLKALEFLTHEVVIGSAPAGPGVRPQPEVWGEPLYDWENRRVTLWVAVQGRGRRLVEDADVTLEVAGRTLPMTRTGRTGDSALARAAPLRYEATVPLDELRPGASPGRVRVMAEGYRPAEQWFALPRPSDSAEAPPLRSERVTVRLHRPDRSYELAFLVRRPAGAPAIAAPSDTDYEGLMQWVETLHGQGAVLLLDRRGVDLRERFGDFVYLIDANGLVLRDEHGWDAAVEPEGLWDRMLHQRLRIAACDARPDSAALRDGDITLDLTVDGRRPGEIVSLEFGRTGDLKINVRTRSRVHRVQLISNLNEESLPGQVLREWTYGNHLGAHDLKIGMDLPAIRPGYVRAIAEAEDGSRAASGAVFIEVRPSVGDAVVARLGESSLYEAPSSRSPQQAILTRDSAAELLPLALGEPGCRSLQIPFTPPETASYILELGLDPGREFDGDREAIRMSLGGDPVANYRAGYPIHGDRVPHIVPFRVPLGRLVTGQPVTIELACEAGGDGIGLTYAYFIRASMPALAMVDLHSHSKADEDWSNLLHRTMGYNYIATGHGAVPDAQFVAAQQRVRELSDGQLTIQHGGERGDRFGAVHMSLGFIDPPLGGRFPPSSGYGSAIPLGFDTGGIAGMNHPSQDRHLSFLTGDRTWGTADPHFHGFAGWSQYQNALGAGDYFWRLLTHFEYFNGYAAIGVASGDPNSNPVQRMRWHEQIGRYVRGERRMPLWALGNSDTKTFQQESQWHIGNMYMGTMVHAASLRPGDIKAALLAGNATISGHADTRLLVSARDAQGRVYLPGHHLPGDGPYTVRVEAWAPRKLSEVRIVGPRGIVSARSVDGHHIVQEFSVESLGAWDWFLVEVSGPQRGTGAISNPCLQRPGT